MFKGILSSGLSFPEFESGNNLFVARIRVDSSEHFKEFIRKRSQSLSQLDEIIILRLLWGKLVVPFDEVCARMQRKPDFAGRILNEMCKKGMAERDGDAYRLAQAIRFDIENIFQSNQMRLDESMWG